MTSNQEQVDKRALDGVFHDIGKKLTDGAKKRFESALSRIRVKSFERDLETVTPEEKDFVTQTLGSRDAGSALTLQALEPNPIHIWISDAKMERPAQELKQRIDRSHPGNAISIADIKRVLVVAAYTHEYAHAVSKTIVAPNRQGVLCAIGYGLALARSAETSEELFNISIDEGITEKIAREAARAYFVRTGDRKAQQTLDAINTVIKSSNEDALYNARQLEVNVVNVFIEYLSEILGTNADTVWKALVSGYLDDSMGCLREFAELVGQLPEQARRLFIYSITNGEADPQTLRRLLAQIPKERIAPSLLARLGISAQQTGRLSDEAQGR